MKLNFPTFTSSSKSLQYGERLNPERDWMLLVSITTLLLLISIAWNVILFYRVTNGDAIGTANAVPPINPASIDSVNMLFQNRANTAADYKNAHFADPAGAALPAAPAAPAVAASSTAS